MHPKILATGSAKLVPRLITSATVDLRTASACAIYREFGR